MQEAATAAPLNDRMLVADVADTLRHGGDVSPDPNTPDTALIERLGRLYRQAGLDLPDELLHEGVAAFRSGRFSYAPPRGPAALLARLYVERGSWEKPVTALLLVLVVGLGGYFLGWQPYRQWQTAQAQAELRDSLPAQMDALYQAIFDETKVQTAAIDAGELRDRGKAAATAGDRSAAEQAIAGLTALKDKLAQAYTLKVVDRDGIKPGFWTFPANNSEATNYYLVVEAVDADGKVLSLPVTSEDNGKTETVDRWGVRVPQTIYDAVIADKADDGVIQHGLIGIKQDGFTDVDYAVPVLGGTVTQW